MAIASTSIEFGGGGASRPSRTPTPNVGTTSSTVLTSSNKVTTAGGTVVNVGTFQIPPIIGPIFPTLPPIIPPPQAPSLTASASDLQVLISEIPIAQDGDAITADYPNSLRRALVAIANRLGIGPVAEEVTVTNAARLSNVADAGIWGQDLGLVTRPVAVPLANLRGWMEMDLPDGQRIRRMVVYATKSGTATLKIKLKRKKVNEVGEPTDLIEINVPNDASASKGIEGDVTVPGAGPVAIEQYRIVNNREHKYLLAAELESVGGPDTSTSAQFHTVQIVCGP